MRPPSWKYGRRIWRTGVLRKQIYPSIPYSPLLNGVAERRSAWPPTLTTAQKGGEDDDLYVPAQEDADEGVTPYERFYGMKADVRNIYGPAQREAKEFRGHGAMGYLSGYKYEGSGPFALVTLKGLCLCHSTMCPPSRSNATRQGAR